MEGGAISGVLEIFSGMCKLFTGAFGLSSLHQIICMGAVHGRVIQGCSSRTLHPDPMEVTGFEENTVLEQQQPLPSRMERRSQAFCLTICPPGVGLSRKPEGTREPTASGQLSVRLHR